MKINRKNKLLFGSILLLLFASYKLAIHKTLVIRTKSAELSSNVMTSANLPKKISSLKQQEVYYDSILNKMNLGNTSIQNNLLKMLNKEADSNQVQVMDFNQPHIYGDGNRQLHTYSFNLQGTYTSILKTIYTIEQNGTFGEIIHITFEKKKNYRKKQSYLEAAVFVRQVK